MSGTALPGPVWHVTLVLTGAPAQPERLRDALEQLCALDPLNLGARFRADQVELQFWDEGRELRDVAAAAADLWRDSRSEVGLPDWSLIDLEVMDTAQWRERQLHGHWAIAPGLVALQV